MNQNHSAEPIHSSHIDHPEIGTRPSVAASEKPSGTDMIMALRTCWSTSSRKSQSRMRSAAGSVVVRAM